MFTILIVGSLWATMVKGQENQNFVGTVNMQGLTTALFETTLELAKSSLATAKNDQKIASKEMRRAMRLKKKYPNIILLSTQLPRSLLLFSQTSLLSNLSTIKEVEDNLDGEKREQIKKLSKEISERIKVNYVLISSLTNLSE